MGLELVAIVGAPNVGKSTLFNRLVGRRAAIVTNEPGVTRDRHYGEVSDAPRPFRLVDTGGMTLAEEMPFAREVERQAHAALDEARVVLFVVDARAGATALDEELASLLRRRGLQPILVGNKVDTPRSSTQVVELHRLGLGAPVEISAEHGLGIEELLEAIARLLPEETARQAAPARTRVALVGRPNVGKSSLLNHLLGEERVVVSSTPGTTRDAVDTDLTLGERHYRLIDTAGLRRGGRVRHVVEHFSARRAKSHIEQCDVAALIVDASQEIAAQDTHIAGLAHSALKPMVIVVNKWDLAVDRADAVRHWEERVRYRLRFANEAPIVFTSALSGQRVLKILDRVDDLFAAAGILVPTQALNRWLQGHADAAPGTSGPGFKMFYATQTGTHPPSFLLFCNDPARAHFSTRRHIENSLREAFGFGSAPIRLEFRGRREATRS